MSHSHTGEFTAAIRDGDWDRAQRLLIELPTGLPDSTLASVAELHMLRERWVEAAETLALMKHRNTDAEMRRKLCLNLASMKMHRPAVYRVLLDAAPSDRYSIVSSRTGHPTIIVRNDTAGVTSMSADNDPLGGVNIAMKSLEEARAGKPLGLLGIGDGYLLGHLSKNPPELILGREQAICIFEPDAHLLLASLSLHDFSGPSGPIEQTRFGWYAGPSWVMQFRDEFFGDLFRMYPGINIRLGLQCSAIEEGLATFLKDVSALDKQCADESREHYERVTRDELIGLLGEHPPRQPRVLVITTRFSTVLQYSATDTADAFRKLGWDAHVAIEPSPSHGMNRIALRHTVSRFKPDVVFQIDHIRSEYGDLFPANMPAVCWIQDHLPNLMNAQAGASVGERDFVLLESAQTYTDKFGYPLRQCIYLNKATRVPPMPEKVEQGGDAMVFVSNCSHDPARLAEGILARIVGDSRDVVQAVCAGMIERYAAGECVATLVELDELVDSVERRHGVRVGTPEQRDALLQALWHPFNDSLYRQQAIRWAASAAQQMGVKLGLYGNGWESNAEFAQHARGYARYGAELEDLTRRTAVNLHIVPFGCIHQRLLDGLVCGGFFMMRDHPVNHFAAALQEFVDAHLPPDVTSVEQARHVLPPPQVAVLDMMTHRYRTLNPTGDPIARLRAAVHRGLTTKLPHLEAVSFRGKDDFAQKLHRFMANADERRAIACEQKAFVERYFTYESNMRRVVGTIHGLIAAESQSERQAA